uniref:Ovule protein n=1 Tax=Steinernema glaseri TaxID=37863 RepID=A0A1I7Y4Y3_9BILA
MFQLEFFEYLTDVFHQILIEKPIQKKTSPFTLANSPFLCCAVEVAAGSSVHLIFPSILSATTSQESKVANGQ